MREVYGRMGAWVVLPSFVGSPAACCRVQSGEECFHLAVGRASTKAYVSGD
jgi:hypothetical protein